jgi:hypothetical protein
LASRYFRTPTFFQSRYSNFTVARLPAVVARLPRPRRHAAHFAEVHFVVDRLTRVDAPIDRRGFWKLQQIAKRDGVSKQAISKKVRKLALAAGLSVTLDARGRIASVDIDQFDQICREAAARAAAWLRPHGENHHAS